MKDYRLRKAGLVLALLIFSNSNESVCGDGDGATGESNQEECNQLRIAYEEMLKGNFKESVEAELEALKANKNSIPARRYLGYSLLKLGLPEQAIKQLQIVRNQGKNSAVDMCIFGEACLRSKQWQSAEIWYKLALKADPHMESARVGLLEIENLKTKETSETGETGERNGAELNLSDADSNLLRELSENPSQQGTPESLSKNYLIPPNQLLERQRLERFSNNQTCNAWEQYTGTRKRRIQSRKP